ncbi:hypothetical protein [Nocardia sp. NPDC050793]
MGRRGLRRIQADVRQLGVNAPVLGAGSGGIANGAPGPATGR